MKDLRVFRGSTSLGGALGGHITKRLRMSVSRVVLANHAADSRRSAKCRHVSPTRVRRGARRSRHPP